MKKLHCLFCSLLAFVLLVSACSIPGSPSSKKETDARNKYYAGDYLAMTKSEIETLLGNKVTEMYYNGGKIYQYEKSLVWFSFDDPQENYDDIPKDAQCFYVMASLRQAATFKRLTVDRNELSETLKFSFGEPEFIEHDGIFMMSAENKAAYCSVSCTEEGIASIDEDYIVYTLKD